MNKISYLEWDSKFFEKRIGKVLIYDENNFDSSKFLKEATKDFDLVYVFSYHKMLSNKTVNSANLDLVDIMLTMSMPFDKDLYTNKEYYFNNSITKNETQECYEIAEEISVVSRFYSEQTIGVEKTKQLYRRWIDNGFNKIFSDGLFFLKN